jgi:uncharacterized protein
MKIVLDTNVLLVAISKKSIFHPIYEALLDKRYSLFITTQILLEYEEILTLRANSIVAKNVLDMLTVRTNVHLVERIYYKWQLVPQDPDDDKFVDCAILADADYLVTNDLHFKAAQKTPFPSVNIINADDFLKIITGL